MTADLMPTKKRSPKARKGPLDSTAEFEKLLRAAPGKVRFVLRLYVTGNSVRSTQAVSNIRSLCEEYLSGRYDLEVVDIYQQPSEAAREQIIAAPTLVRELPVPPKRLIGDLSDRDKVLVGLNIVDNGAAVLEPKTKWLKL